MARAGSLALRWIACITLVAPGCAWLPKEGGFHEKGDRFAIGRVFWADPIVGKAIAWNGMGDVRNYGGSLQNYWYQTDRAALGVGLTLVNFDTPDGDVLGGELEARFRYHFTETDLLGFFWDFNGGVMQTESGIPPGGTRGNFTFAFGPGVELPLGENSSLLFGIEFHHMSNALGRDSPRNPSQNEFLFWLGYGFTW